jgi:hypothetical protein
LVSALGSPNSCWALSIAVATAEAWPLSEAAFRLAACMYLSVARLMASILTPTPMPLEIRFDWLIVLRT